MNRFEITFGTPVHGWLVVDVSFGNVFISAEVADGLDTITDLLSALYRISNGSTEEEVAWPNEPDYYVWTFKVIGEQLIFCITDPNDKKFTFEGELKTSLRIFVSSLTRLSKNPVWSVDKNQIAWAFEFPYQKLRELDGSISDV